MLDPQQALQQYFGFDHFREGQEVVIQRILKGQHSKPAETRTIRTAAILLPADMVYLPFHSLSVSFGRSRPGWEKCMAQPLTYPLPRRII
jgi:hypothetical protein